MTAAVSLASIPAVAGAPSITQGAPSINDQIAEIAGFNFDAMPAVSTADTLWQQHLWVLAVARHMLAKTKDELRADMDVLAEGGPEVLPELSTAMIAAANSFRAAASLCDKIIGRMAVAAAANIAAS